MSMLGVVEGFFGPQWSQEGRESYAEFLRKNGADFYIYAPKQDQHLRKAWRQDWGDDFFDHLNGLRSVFQKQGILFGVALSPFELGETLREEDKVLLKKKIEFLRSINIDLLGIFFDDMHSHPGLAEVQVEAMKLIEKEFPGQIIFCPTYYCFDPILDKVFGKMPEGYLEKIGNEIPQRVSIAWTGPKVISPEIPLAHLQEVEGILKRKPFIWENLFANDGPRNCKFLKVKSFAGRSSEVSALTEAWGFNMMNQPFLSQITFRASQLVLQNGLSPDQGLDQAISELCSPEFGAFLSRHRGEFETKGLDNFSREETDKFQMELLSFSDAGAREISFWLQGFYNVGSECLTD